MPKDVQDHAASLGIALPDARPLLRPWEPVNAARDTVRRNRMPVGQDAVLLEADMAIPDQQALDRAFDTHCMNGRLYDPSPSLTGYPWYDRLSRITDMTFMVTSGDQTTSLQGLRDAGDIPESNRPERIQAILHYQQPDGTTRDDAKDTDIAFLNEGEDDYIDNVLPLVTKDSQATVHELSDLLTEAYFSPSYGGDADSYETQKHYHDAESHAIALRTLLPKDEALKATIAQSRQGQRLLRRAPRHHRHHCDHQE